MLLKDISILVTQNQAREIKENIDVKIERSRIADIGRNLDGGEIIDCSDRIVLPGLINCHTHVSMTVLRGIEDDEELDSWLFDHVIPAENQMGGKHVRKGAELGIVEMLKTGTTCFNDMYAPEEKVAQAARDIGIRASLGKGIIDKDRDTETELEKSRKFIRSWIGEDLISPVVNPHSVYTCSKDALSGSIDQSKEFSIPVHIHVSETEDENEKSIEKNDAKPLSHLAGIGLLERKVIAAHCTQLDNEDIEIMKEKKIGVAYCPSANLKLGSGIAPVPKMLNKGIKVGIGTDGPASNNSLNMFEEMKTASLIQKNKDPREMDAQTVLDMATIHGAGVLGMDQIGRIKEGWKADLVIVEIDESMRPARKENIVSHLVFSNPEVSETIVNGNLVVSDGSIQSEIDLQNFEQLSRELW